MFSLTSLKTLKPQRQQETKTQTPTSMKWRSDYNRKFEDGKQMEKTFYQREEVKPMTTRSKPICPWKCLWNGDTRGTLEDGIRVFRLLIIVGLHVAFTTLEEPTLQWPHIGSLKSTIVGVFTLQEWANTTNQSFILFWFF